MEWEQGNCFHDDLVMAPGPKDAVVVLLNGPSQIKPPKGTSLRVYQVLTTLNDKPRVLHMHNGSIKLCLEVAF